MSLSLGGCDGNCVAARLLREENERLRRQVDDLMATNLALVDAKAHAVRYPQPRQPAAAGPAGRPPERHPGGPADFRNQRFRPTETSEEIEARFAAQIQQQRAEQEAS